MKVELKKHVCTITREPGDSKIHSGVVNAAGESRFLYAVKRVLNAQGYDLIKKRMWKDGHLVDDCQQYLRSRNPKSKGLFCIYNGFFAIEGADERYNREGSVDLLAVWNEVEV